jgi:hypothetical protein
MLRLDRSINGTPIENKRVYVSAAPNPNTDFNFETYYRLKRTSSRPPADDTF